MSKPILGITGGIGSGKSIICDVFKTLGVAVFHADDEAKKLYDTRPDILDDIKQYFGAEVFDDTGQLNKAKLAGRVFSNHEALKTLNTMVHPRVAERFNEWALVQSSSYLIREAAILIESGSHKDCSKVAVVIADDTLRVQRVMRRSGLSRVEVENRMKAQWSDEQRLAYADYVLNNNESELLLPQIMRIHQELLKA